MTLIVGNLVVMFAVPATLIVLAFWLLRTKPTPPVPARYVPEKIVTRHEVWADSWCTADDRKAFRDRD